MEYILALIGLSPEQISTTIAAFVAILLFKGIEYALKGLAKLAGKTDTPLDDQVIAKIAEAIRAKIK